MTSMMMMMMTKVVMMMTPWKKDDNHDEGVEGLLTDHPVDHFPHTRKNQIITIFDIFSDQTKLLMYILKTEKQGKLCRKQSVCRISLTQEIMTIQCVDFSWSMKARWEGCPTVRYEIHMLGERVQQMVSNKMGGTWLRTVQPRQDGNGKIQAKNLGKIHTSTLHPNLAKHVKWNK